MTASQKWKMGRRAMLFSLGGGALVSGLPGIGRVEAKGSIAAPFETLLKQGQFAAAAIIVTEGGREVDWAFWGKASPAFDVAVDETTLFHVGSIGKHVTAVAILRLVEAGRLDLDDPLGKHVRDLSPSWSRPTIRQILGHISGLPGNFETQDLDRPFTREIVSRFSHSISVVAPPGQAWVYSNVGYVLLGYVIENLTGQSYGEHITHSIFRPFGLVDSRADDAEAIVPRRAEPVEMQEGIFHRATQMSTPVSSVAAGGLLFSPRDIAAWGRAQSGTAMLSAASKQAMFNQAWLDTGRGTGYGMGWRIVDERGVTPIHIHTGSVPGFVGAHIRLPEKDRAIMVMATGYGPTSGIGLEVAEMLWPRSTPLSAPDISDRAPEWTSLVQSIVVNGAALDKARLAPELGRLPPEVADSTIFRLNDAWTKRFQRLRLTADTVSGDERRRRYVIELEGLRLPLLVYYARDGALVRIVS